MGDIAEGTYDSNKRLGITDRIKKNYKDGKLIEGSNGMIWQIISYREARYGGLGGGGLVF